MAARRSVTKKPPTKKSTTPRTPRTERSASGGKKPKATRAGRAGQPSPIDLAAIRQRINDLDRQLVQVLNERSSLVVKVGEYKRAVGLPVYAPHREAEVLERALKTNTGPLPDRTLEAIYRELMSGSFALQQPLRIGFLGPPGSYSHLAAMRHFGGSVEHEDVHDIPGVFTQVQRGLVHYGLVPIENSTGGGIVETLDAFRDLAHRGKAEVSICAEVQIEVRHCLLANCAPGRIARIFSKPEVFEQCRAWLGGKFPKAERIPTPSSSRAAELVAEESRRMQAKGQTPDCAALGSELAGQIYGLNPLLMGVEDNPGNITRFLVISRQTVERTGDDKTTVMFNTADRPGALVAVLQAFERHSINLTHIEKRPSGRRNWTYTFFVDAQGHQTDPGMIAALHDARQHCRELIALGSYPRSKRIL
ncbi:MAG: bifunctional chorismate mutase/prephenate dehydratase [Phycisphaeraceae bacterium]|nr:bifunctional chorismate mutase/prephenate dehydratase [Phycisphaeraceae bacterium]